MCDKQPSFSAKSKCLPESASSGLSAGPSTADLQGQAPSPTCCWPSQGQGPIRKTDIDVLQMMWLAGRFGLSGVISHVEATMPKNVDPGGEPSVAASAGETDRDLAVTQFPRNCVPYNIIEF